MILIIEYITKVGPAPRREIVDLLFDKLPDVLSEEQKVNKVKYLLSLLKNRDFKLKIERDSKANMHWILRK